MGIAGDNGGFYFVLPIDGTLLGGADLQSKGANALELTNLQIGIAKEAGDGFVAASVGVYPKADLEQIESKLIKTAKLAADPQELQDAGLHTAVACTSEADCPGFFGSEFDVDTKSSDVLPGNMLALSPLSVPLAQQTNPALEFCQKCVTHSGGEKPDVSAGGGTIDYCTNRFNCQDFSSASQACANELGFGDNVRQSVYKCTSPGSGQQDNWHHNIAMFRQVITGDPNLYYYCAYEPQQMNGVCSISGPGLITTDAILDCWLTEDDDAFSLNNADKSKIGCDPSQPFATEAPFEGHWSCDAGYLDRPWFKDGKLRWFGTRRGLSDYWCSDPLYIAKCGPCPPSQSFYYTHAVGKLPAATGEVTSSLGSSCGVGCTLGVEKSLNPPERICGQIVEATTSRADFMKWNRCDGETLDVRCDTIFNYYDSGANEPEIKKKAIALFDTIKFDVDECSCGVYTGSANTFRGRAIHCIARGPDGENGQLKLLFRHDYERWPAVDPEAKSTLDDCNNRCAAWKTEASFLAACDPADDTGDGSSGGGGTAGDDGADDVGTGDGAGDDDGTGDVGAGDVGTGDSDEAVVKIGQNNFKDFETYCTETLQGLFTLARGCYMTEEAGEVVKVPGVHLDAKGFSRIDEIIAFCTSNNQCNHNGVCEVGEWFEGCPSDCANKAPIVCPENTLHGMVGSGDAPIGLYLHGEFPNGNYNYNIIGKVEGYVSVPNRVGYTTGCVMQGPFDAGGKFVPKYKSCEISEPIDPIILITPTAPSMEMPQ